MNRFTMWIAAGIWLFLPYVAFAGTISVAPIGAITTIQAGINAALNGDEVVIADGTYTGNGNVNLDFGGKKITVRSAHGPAAVIIDCQDLPNTRGVLFDNPAEDSNAVLEGVTITRGSSDYGAGISIENGASPTIRNVRLVDNHTINPSGNNGGGGAIVTDSGSNPTFVDCAISNNTAGDTSGSNGGGIRITNQANATIINCVIDGNSAAAGIANNGQGGGIYVANASLTLVGSTVSDNQVGYVGGGITARGGASTSVSIVGSWIFGNYAGFKGGGIRFDSIDPANTVEVINTLFFDNDAAQDGAAVDSYRASPVFTNVTMSGNLSGVPVVNLHTAGNPASPIPTNVRFVNSILWGNSDPVISTQADIDTDGNSSLTIDYSDVQNGALSWDAFTDGTGNVDLDPLFIDPASDDYRIQTGSLVIDAGDDSAVPAGITQDLAGADRIMGTAVDMGAFEHNIIRFSELAYNVDEGDGFIDITVQRTDSGVGAIDVDYTTVDGTAVSGSDYVTANGSLHWNAGDTSSQTFSITITDDNIEELLESIKLELSDPISGAILSVAALSITDNDGGIIAAGGGGSGGGSAAAGGGGGGGGCFIQSAASDIQISVWPIAMLLTGVIGLGWFLGRKNP